MEITLQEPQRLDQLQRLRFAGGKRSRKASRGGDRELGRRRVTKEEKPASRGEPAQSLEPDARSRALPGARAQEPRPLTEPDQERRRPPLGPRTAVRGSGAGRAGVPRRSWPPRRPIGRRSKRAQVVTGIKWVTRPSGSPATALSAPGLPFSLPLCRGISPSLRARTSHPAPSGTPIPPLPRR